MAERQDTQCFCRVTGPDDYAPRYHYMGFRALRRQRRLLATGGRDRLCGQPSAPRRQFLRGLQVEPRPSRRRPGWSFTEVASYTFPDENQSFDPVLTYDSFTGLIHIVGTQDSTASLSPPIPAEVLPVRPAQVHVRHVLGRPGGAGLHFHCLGSPGRL